MKARFVNVRGCNGTGKTHLLRALVALYAAEAVLHVVKVPAHAEIPVTVVPGKFVVLGNYTASGAASTTAGCDRIKTQQAAKDALETLARDIPDVPILFEGVVISTIFVPWLEWERKNGGMVWAFLDTPLDVCLSRIQARNGGKPVKTEQIAGKHRTIDRVRKKANLVGAQTHVLVYQNALEELGWLLRKLKGGDTDYEH